MSLRFLATALALPLILMLTACGGGGSNSMLQGAGPSTHKDCTDPTDDSTCTDVPDGPAASCPFPTGNPPVLVAPVSSVSLSTRSITILIADTDATPYVKTRYNAIVSTDANPDDISTGQAFFASSSVFSQTTGTPPAGDSVLESATIPVPNSHLSACQTYNVYVITTGGCGAAGPIGTFSTVP
jgi:hypothetical protein